MARQRVGTKRQRIGITGLAGFLGGETAALLSSVGHQVVDLDAYCRDPSSAALRAVPTPLDWVLHFAARTSIVESLEDPEGFRRDNLAATRAALEVAAERGAALLLMSSYVYGRPHYNPVDERHPIAALNPYMASKIAAERLATEVCGAAATPLVVLRPFSIYGARRQPGRLVSDLVDRAAQGRRLRLNDPAPSRDHLHSSDFCRLVRAIVQVRPAATGVYNVGSGVEHANIEVARTLARLVGDERPVEVFGRPRPGDVSVCVADIHAVTEAFGWRPTYSLERGLAEVLEARRGS